jgi:hypothetical protein
MSLNDVLDVDKVDEEIFFRRKSVSGNPDSDQLDGSA